MKYLLNIFVLLFLFQTSTWASDGIQFSEESYDITTKRAKTQGKLMFLDFTASWCMPCKKMERETFTNKLLGDFVNSNFISMQVDVDWFWGMDVAEKYNVTAYPTILVVDTKGNVVRTIRGFQSASQLLSQLRSLDY